MHLKCIATIVFRLCLLLLLLLCRWFHALIMVLEGALLNRHFGMHLYCSNRWGICRRDWFSWDRTQCCVLRCSAGYQQRWTGQLLHSTHGRRFLSPACTAQTTQNGEVKLQELSCRIGLERWRILVIPEKNALLQQLLGRRKHQRRLLLVCLCRRCGFVFGRVKWKLGNVIVRAFFDEGERAVAERRW